MLSDQTQHTGRNYYGSFKLYRKRAKGQHLNYEERIKIEALNKIGMKSEKIAAEIGCSGRTIRRELAKGRTELLNSDLTTRTEYSADRGQKSHDYAATAKGAMLKIGKDYKLVKEIERLIIKEKMSAVCRRAIHKKLRQIHNCTFLQDDL